MSLCDTLLRCAQSGLYRPLWSAEIIDEFSRNLIAQGRVTPEQAVRRALHKRAAFPQADVRGYEDLIPALRCDPKDRHVLAVAIHGGAQAIITKNLADFPAPAVRPYNIEIQHPDTFLCALYELDASALVRAVQQQATALRNPPMTIDKVLAALAVHVPDFASRIKLTISKG